MDSYKFSEYVRVLLLILLMCRSVSLVHGDGEVAKIEKSIHDYRKYVDGFVWKWMTPPLTCDQLKLVSHRSEAYISRSEIMLESQKCTPILMEILECVYYKRSQSREFDVEVGAQLIVRGVNGEAYQVESPETLSKCFDPYTPVIKKCIHTGEDMRIDFSEIEELFCKNHELITSQKWMNGQTVCELVCPEYFDLDKVTIDKETVLLESTSCKRVEMDILKCTCQNRRSSTFKTVYCARGVGGEVYEMSESDKDHEPETFYIRKRIIDFEGKQVVALCPQTEKSERKILSAL